MTEQLKENAMKPERLLLAGFAAAALAALPVTAAPPPGAQRVALIGRTLTFRLPAGFVEVVNRSNGTNVLIEYVPRGENVTNWSRMVTIQAYRGLGASPRTTADIARQAFYPAACRNGPIYSDSGERVYTAGVRRSIVANGCASLPAGAYPAALAGAGEQDFIMVFRDAQSIYTLNYAVRGAAFAGKAPPIPVARGEAYLREIFGNVTL